MKLVTSDQMRRVDSETINNYGIPGPKLMENAGRGIAQNISDKILNHSNNAKVVIICGKGNNGGDGFVIGRYLHEDNAEITIYYMGPVEKLTPDAKLNYDRALKQGIALQEINSIDDLPKHLNCDLIIDAIFGTGFSGVPRGLSGELIEYINKQNTPVAAVDLPSGLNADTGQHEGTVVRVDYSFPLALPKYGLYISPGRELAGDVTTVPIGVPDEVINKFDLKTELITPEKVSSLLPYRKPDGHKGDFGKLFLVAGSLGMTGAAALSAKSALRSGCGLVKIGCPKSVLPTIAQLAMEATLWPLPDVAKKGALATRGLGEILNIIKDHNAIAIGPGLGQHRETKELIRRLIPKLEIPAVIDADGLNALSGFTNILNEKNAPMVLTPHPGEFKRLTGEPVPSDIHERIKAAKSFAQSYNIVLVLKGSPTIITDPDGNCYLNPTGNNGMATGGSGDVLTGTIGSFLAGGMTAINAAICGVYIHGLAGDIAITDLGETSLIAGDLVDYLPEAFSIL